MLLGLVLLTGPIFGRAGSCLAGVFGVGHISYITMHSLPNGGLHGHLVTLFSAQSMPGVSCLMIFLGSQRVPHISYYLGIPSILLLLLK